MKHVAISTMYNAKICPWSSFKSSFQGTCDIPFHCSQSDPITYTSVSGGYVYLQAARVCNHTQYSQSISVKASLIFLCYNLMSYSLFNLSAFLDASITCIAHSVGSRCVHMPPWTDKVIFVFTYSFSRYISFQNFIMSFDQFSFQQVVIVEFPHYLTFSILFLIPSPSTTFILIHPMLLPSGT